MSEPNILIIVEGAQKEKDLFEHLFKLYGIKGEIFVYGTNIYGLYGKMKSYDFNADIKDVLAEVHPEYSDLLSRDYAYTYLIFDCDAHHERKEETRNFEEIVKDNFETLGEMAQYFDNETDPTIGKMYINYPMMESLRYCDSFFDERYKDKTVKLNGFHEFKSISGKTKLSGKHLECIGKKEIGSLICQNVFKMNYLMKGNWAKPSYSDYLSESCCDAIVNKQKAHAFSDGFVYVLNTSVFLVVDYFGNNDSFYDNEIIGLQKK